MNIQKLRQRFFKEIDKYQHWRIKRNQTGIPIELSDIKDMFDEAAIEGIDEDETNKIKKEKTELAADLMNFFTEQNQEADEK